MRYLKYTVAFVAVATLGLSGVAEAQNRSRGEGRGMGRPGVEQRVGPRGFANQVDRRQATQRARIRDGRQSGELNRRELGRLRQDQRQVRRLENRFGADGRYSPRERRILDRKLDRSSRNIYRARNNDRPAFGNHGSRSGFGNGHDRPGFGNHTRGWARPDHRGRGPRHDYRPGHRRGYRPISYEAPVEIIEPSSSSSNALEIEMNGVRASWSRASTM